MSDVINMHHDLNYRDKAALIIKSAIQAIDDLAVDPGNLYPKQIIIGKMAEALKEVYDDQVCSACGM